MNIIPSVPVKQPSDAASVSADTMMNSYRHPSHRKELFSFRTFHSQERGTILYTGRARSDTELSRWSCCHYSRQCIMSGCFWVSVFMSLMLCNTVWYIAVLLFAPQCFNLAILSYFHLSSQSFLDAYKSNWYWDIALTSLLHVPTEIL